MRDCPGSRLVGQFVEQRPFHEATGASHVRDNTTRAKLLAGEPTLGSFLGLGSPHIAEMLGHAGFDWLGLETEHSAVESERVEQMMMAMGGTVATPIVRVTRGDPLEIARVLDIGAMGVIVPMVRTATDVETIVNATRYPPAGSRGFGPLRASRYAQDYEDYLNRANEQIVVAVIIETAEAIENINQIAAVPGLDVMFLGLYDLCLSYGFNPNEMPFPQIDACIEQVLGAGVEHQVAVGMGVGSPEDLRQRRDQGFRFLSYGTDYMLLAGAARAGIEAFGAV